MICRFVPLVCVNSKNQKDSSKHTEIFRKTALGGNAWESNPPKMLLTPQAGFEDTMVLYSRTFIVISIVIV